RSMPPPPSSTTTRPTRSAGRASSRRARSMGRRCGSSSAASVRAYVFILQAFAYVAAVLVGAMALAVTLDVIGRNLGWSNTGWVVEVTEYSLPVATLLVAPYLLYRNEHVRLDVVLAIVPKRVSLFLER